MNFKSDRVLILAAGLAFLLLLGIGLSKLPEGRAQAGSLSEPPGAAAKTTVVVGAKVFDGEAFVTGVTVVVSGDRIVAVVPDADIPEAATVIHAEGKTLLPGLIDAHVHSYGSALEDSLLFDVTTVLDMFTDHQQAARWRDEQAAGTATTRADIVSAGTLVTPPGGHGTQFGMEIPTITTPEEADAFVAARLAEGSDFIKIVLEDGSLYGRPLPTLDEATVRAVVAAAHARGKLAVAHVSTLAKGRLALAAGVDGLVHMYYDQPVDQPWLAAAKAGEIFVAPTSTVLESATGTASGASLVADERLAPYLSARATANLEMAFPQPPDRPAGTQYGQARSNVGALHDAGISILAGTDAPNPGTWYGVSMHRELALLVEAGLSSADALRAATSAPADAFGLDDRGRIAPGKLADLVLVDGDPEQDILATRAIERIWRRGQPVERGNTGAAGADGGAARAILEAGPVAAFDAKANWQPSTDEMMGGKSVVEMTVVEGDSASSGNALEIRGEIRAGFPYPWAGAMYFPGPAPMSPVDASALTELVFQVQGGGSAHRVMFFAESLGRIPGQSFFTASEEWNEVVIPFTAIAGLDPAGLMGVLFSGPMTAGEFAFTIDRVSFR